MEHVATALRRGLAKVRRRSRAPLEPDAFLVWAYHNTPGTKAPGTQPLALDDVAFELRQPVEELRRSYVRIAARVRRNQRLGRDPWEGI